MLDALRALINPHCEICGEIHPFIDNRRRICQGCKDDLSWIDSRCRRCGLPLSTEVEQCGECLKRQPKFHHSAIPWVYDYPVSAAITAYKHHGKRHFGNLLSNLMADFLSGHYAEAQRPWPQALLPVPLHRNRELLRGFNQANEIAAHLARHFQLPVVNDLMLRARDTASQQGLDRRQRRQNLKNAFQVVKRTGFRRIAIVDDVVTTATTVDGVAAQLDELGVTDIHIWAFARTPSSPDH